MKKNRRRGKGMNKRGAGVMEGIGVSDGAGRVGWS